MVVFTNKHAFLKEQNNHQLSTLTRTLAVPFVFVVNDAFALSVTIIKPYAGHNPGSSTPERIFNYRLEYMHNC